MLIRKRCVGSWLTYISVRIRTSSSALEHLGVPCVFALLLSDGFLPWKLNIVAENLDDLGLLVIMCSIVVITEFDFGESLLCRTVYLRNVSSGSANKGTNDEWQTV